MIIGHLIPAGTGMKIYQNVKLFDDKSEDLDAYVQTIIEQRRLEEQQKAEEEGQDDAAGVEIPAPAPATAD